MTADQADKTQTKASLDLYSPKGNMKFKAIQNGEQNFAEIMNLIKKYVAESFPVTMDLIIQTDNQDDKRDHTLRAFANTWRQILKYLSRRDCLKLWAKIHSLFQLKLDVQDASKSKRIEPLCVSDIQEQLFKLDTFFTKEQASLEYALNKMEFQRSETRTQFERVIS